MTVTIFSPMLDNRKNFETERKSEGVGYQHAHRQTDTKDRRLRSVSTFYRLSGIVFILKPVLHGVRTKSNYPFIFIVRVS